MKKNLMYQPPIEDSSKKLRKHVAELAKKTGRRRGSIAKQAMEIGLTTIEQRCAIQDSESF